MASVINAALPKKRRRMRKGFLRKH